MLGRHTFASLPIDSDANPKAIQQFMGHSKIQTTFSGMGSVACESRRTDDEAAVIAADRIRSGAADDKEDGAEALASLDIRLPKE